MRSIFEAEVGPAAQVAGTRRALLRSSFASLLAFLYCVVAFGQNADSLRPKGVFQPTNNIPKTVNVGMGIVPFSSGVAMPEPESGGIEHGTYINRYFDLSYALPQDWIESFKGPPPSATGYYVLSQLRTSPADEDRGTMMISASDMFFLLHPATTALELLQQSKRALPDVLKVERPPAEVRIGNRSFVRMDYTGAEIHWSVLATEIRCHTVQFVFTSRDPQLIENLVQGLGKLNLPSEDKFPVCIKDYATKVTVIHEVDPILVGPKYTSVPVRVIVGEDGRVEHLHVITAFPEQAHSISDALMQWTFKPYLHNGHAVEVETGLLFEFKPDGVKSVNPEKQLSEQH